MEIILHIVYITVLLVLLVRELWPSRVWLAIATVLLALHTFSGWFGTAWAVVLWIFWLVLLVFSFAKNLRMQVITQPIYAKLKKILPPISETEQQAIRAGTVWWEAELFGGKPKWERLFDRAPTPELTEEEQAFFDNETETLCGLFNEWDANRTHKDLSPQAWEYIKANKFFGMMIPKEYGGLGFSEHAHAAVVTKVATASVAGCVTVMVPNSLGPGKLILHYGTQAQKDHYLPRLAASEEIPCFALTAPNAGSDAAAIPDTGVVCKGEFEGKEVLGLRLNWDKRYITLAPVATLLGLAFYAYDPDGLLEGEEELGLTCALVPTTTEGVEIGRRHDPLEVPFQNGPTQGKDVFIPLDWVIGGAENLGKGWKMLMESLATGRGISLPALGNAVGQASVLTASAYANVRTQFNLPIGKFGGVAEVLADIGGSTYLMDSLSKLMTTGLELGQCPAVLSAMVKYFNTDTARTVINHNMDIHAGKGIMVGPKNYLADRAKGIPIAITVEGANILTRSLMIFGQGAFRCHPYLQGIMQSVQSEELEQFDRILFKYIRHVYKNKLRVWLYGLSRGYLSPVGKQSHMVKTYQRQVNTLSAVFAVLVDASVGLLGGEIKRKEILTGHFVDAWLGLVTSSAALKKFVAEGEQTQDWAIVSWACQKQLALSYQALERAVDSLPQAWVSSVLRTLFWPIKRPRMPSAARTEEVATLLLQDQSVRQRLTQWCYVPSEADNPITTLLAANAQMDGLRNIERTIKGHKPAVLESEQAYAARLQTEGILSAEEVAQWQAAIAAQAQACAVDDFDVGAFGAKTREV